MAFLRMLWPVLSFIIVIWASRDGYTRAQTEEQQQQTHLKKNKNKKKSDDVTSL
jgi:hypothetical protein